MTTFQDGPAQGQTLSLSRAPRFLRVVEAAGKWDALDQLDDQAKPSERIVAYEITARPGMVHLHRRGGGGWFAVASYRVVAEQPSDAQLRDNGQWSDWVHAYAEKHPFTE